MNEEELKSIEYLKGYKYDNEVRQAIDIALNLIEKQQTKLDKIGNQLKNQIEHCENENVELYDKCSINLKFNKSLLKILEE